MCFLWAAVTILVFTHDKVNGRAGSGPTKSIAEPSRASSSAISLPYTSVCPGTQMRVTKFLSSNLIRSFLHSKTSLDLN
jgi:hypothetical protein